MTVYDYAKLKAGEKEEILKSGALFLENYKDGDKIIFVYFLNGFFVEVTMRNGKVIDNLPYKRGFKVNRRDFHNIEKRNTVYDLAA